MKNELVERQSLVQSDSTKIFRKVFRQRSSIPVLRNPGNGKFLLWRNLLVRTKPTGLVKRKEFKKRQRNSTKKLK
ncbi:hypothetical protein [Flavobacterium sp.]|uniref:hypothetical protein n=1 Tax=Flavobacterium sp. TaxID=239 RepID=UPI0039E38EA0